MTLYELRSSVEQANKGKAYELYKQAVLVGQVIVGKLPEFDKACKEFLPEKKSYKMPEWIQERYNKQRGVK